jgi:hypothetical protein
MSVHTAIRPRFARAVGAAFAAIALLSDAALAAGGAFIVDDAAVDDPFSCKIETSGSFGGNQSFIGISTPACVLPLFKPTEIGVNLIRTRGPDGEWGAGVLPKFKMNILPVETGKFGLAIVGGSLFNAMTGEYAATFFNVPVTYTFSESLKINLNAGWLYERADDRHSATYGAGFEWMAHKQLTMIGEVFGVATEHPEARTVVDPRFQIGLRVTPIDTMDFDVIYGRNIGGENANWITLGWNVRFPAPKK